MVSRDRHGRGLRAPLLPAGAPGRRSRRERFDAIMVECVDRLAGRWGDSWGRVEFGVEDVPPSTPAPWERGSLLGRLFPAQPPLPARIVLYRMPVEQRAAGAADLARLVRDVLAENVAHLLGRRPSEVDPDYGS